MNPQDIRTLVDRLTLLEAGEPENPSRRGFLKKAAGAAAIAAAPGSLLKGIGNTPATQAPATQAPVISDLANAMADEFQRYADHYLRVAEPGETNIEGLITDLLAKVYREQGFKAGTRAFSWYYNSGESWGNPEDWASDFSDKFDIDFSDYSDIEYPSHSYEFDWDVAPLSPELAKAMKSYDGPFKNIDTVTPPFTPNDDTYHASAEAEKDEVGNLGDQGNKSVSDLPGAGGMIARGAAALANVKATELADRLKAAVNRGMDSAYSPLRNLIAALSNIANYGDKASEIIAKAERAVDEIDKKSNTPALPPPSKSEYDDLLTPNLDKEKPEFDYWKPGEEENPVKKNKKEL